ncbi:aspartate/glutamate racemase family protein [Methylobacterium oryzae]|uniref:aspartate/glutamate racemase family protein n=1 Tax=Methylobacterium oryzae TaxID=334852 RepID=UPI002F34F162
MRILLLNPNTSAAMTARMARAAAAALAPDAHITALTAATGLPYIASRAEAHRPGRGRGPPARPPPGGRRTPARC